MENDKTKLNSQDETKSLNYDASGSNMPTIESTKGSGFPDKSAAGKDDSLSGEKTITFFNKTDIKQKLQDELDDVPEIHPEDMQSGYLSNLISKPFSHKTEEERLKINRNFLRDAEPLTLERLKDEIDNESEKLFLGFPSLDHCASLPRQKLTLIASKPQQGKTLFMLNMLLNICRKHSRQHFLYYSYGEPRQDIEIKLINMSGETPFAPLGKECITSNFKRWIYELKNQDIRSLKDKAENDPPFKGLKNLLEISSRIHIIDTNYNINDLIDSLQAFNNTLTVGAVFFDYLQAIRPEKSQLSLPRHQQVLGIANKLIDMANECRFPMILGTQMTGGEKDTPEYDTLTLDHLQDFNHAEQVADLVIALQNNTESTFIGSNNDQLKSRFYKYTPNKPGSMPENFKDKQDLATLLAKILVNRGGPLIETELVYNKRLMKINDPKK